LLIRYYNYFIGDTCVSSKAMKPTAKLPEWQFRKKYVQDLLKVKGKTDKGLPTLKTPATLVPFSFILQDSLTLS